jgi:hypothetical protein
VSTPDYQLRYENSYALVVGIDTYSDPRLVPLGNAEADARSVSEVLAAPPYGFEVRQLLGGEATRDAVLEALYALRATGHDDRVLFYFAGHGYTLTNRRGHETGYLACADTIPEKDYTALELDRVTALRDHTLAKHVTFILDSCFSGQALGLTRSGTDVAADKYLLRRAYQALSAGAGDQTVSDAQSMTGLLVEGLRGGAEGDILLTLNTLGFRVQQTMAADTKSGQIPQFGHLTHSQGGDLVFYTPSEAQPIDKLPEELDAGLATPAGTASLALRLSCKPETVESDEAVVWTVTLRNDGDVDMRYVTVQRELMLLDDPFELAAGKGRSFTFEEQYAAEDPTTETVTATGFAANGEDLFREAEGMIRLVLSSKREPDSPVAEVIEPEPTPRVDVVLPEHTSELEPAPPIESTLPTQEPQYEPPTPEQVNVLSILPPPFEWCDIPVGRATPAGTDWLCDIQPFSMAKYPVTYAQFQVFVDAPDGFHSDQWWEGLAAVARHRMQPGDQSWKVDNHPRENVSWYDAVVFCRWLSSKLGKEVRLPTEWEWQWAAEGYDRLMFPWGHRYDQNKCNSSMSRIMKTTPVDRYLLGASPFGVMDMAGNVLEWCLNEYVTAEFGLAGGVTRTQRGSSWARGLPGRFAASRTDNYPNFRHSDLGFRVAVGRPPSL